MKEVLVLCIAPGLLVLVLVLMVVDKWFKRIPYVREARSILWHVVSLLTGVTLVSWWMKKREKNPSPPPLRDEHPTPILDTPLTDSLEERADNVIAEGRRIIDEANDADDDGVDGDGPRDFVDEVSRF